MSKKRKTITFSQDDLVMAEGLNPSEQGMFYTLLIKHFLYSQPINLEELSDTLKVAVLGTLPKIRAMQAKFTNGNVGKNFNEKNRAPLCPVDRSETKQKEANGSESIYNNYPLNNNYNILKKYIMIDQSPARARGANSDKTTDAPVVEALNQLQSKPKLYNLITKIIETIDRPAPVKINGAVVDKSAIAKELVYLLSRQDFEIQLESAVQEVNNTAGVRDKVKYLLAMLFNLARSLRKPAQNPHGFAERTYSTEELNALYDALDDTSLD